MKRFCLFTLFFVNLFCSGKKRSIKDLNSTSIKETKTTFGVIDASLISVQNNANFKNFMKEFKKSYVLKKINDRFIGYNSNDFLYIYDLKTDTYFKLKFDLARNDKIQAFSCDDSFVYVKFRHYIRVYSFKGAEISCFKFNHGREISGMDILVSPFKNQQNHGSILYLFTHNKDLLAFFFSKKSLKTDLLFHQNDFKCAFGIKFNFHIDDQFIYVFENKRFAVVDKFSGKVLKNVYLKVSFDHMLILNDCAFLYSNGRFASIDLKNDYQISYNESIKLAGKVLSFNNGNLVYNGKAYVGDYIMTRIFKNMLFRFAENTYDSNCFLINSFGKTSSFVLQQFVISHIFYTSKGLTLIDTKNHKIYFIN